MTLAARLIGQDSSLSIALTMENEDYGTYQRRQRNADDVIGDECAVD